MGVCRLSSSLLGDATGKGRRIPANYDLQALHDIPTRNAIPIPSIQQEPYANNQRRPKTRSRHLPDISQPSRYIP